MSTDWVFTDYSQLDESFWTNWFNEGDLQYLACQVETCPSTGQLHIQGFVIFKNRKRLVPTLKRIDPTRHWEKRKATLRQAAANYATKHDTRSGWTLQMGEFDEVEQGKRNDLDEIKNEIIAGASIESICDRHFGTAARYLRFFEKYKLMKAKNQDSVPEVYVFWGNTGTGKSREAWEKFPNAYDKSSSDWWWDGYDGVSPVIIDEFTGQIPIEAILKITDRHPNRVPFKGGMMKFAAKVIVFTSNVHPNNWWPRAVNYAAFERRCKEIKLFE